MNMKCTLLLIALLAAAAPFFALLIQTPLRKAEIAPAATQQPLPTAAPDVAPKAATASDLAAQPLTLYDAAIGAERTVEVPEFLIGVAACELPPDWSDDALQAQMVAGHSYALSLGDDPLQVNSAQCSGWTDDAVLKARWGNDFEENYARFAALSQQVSGALLCWQGAPAAACYHSISNGRTEASQNVWVTALPYLQGVASPWDKAVDGYEVSITYAPEQVSAVLQTLSLTPGDNPAAWFGEVILDEAGYVDTLKVCGSALRGTALRSAFGLRSTAFTVDYKDDAFTFTTHGYGHGVGLSQYGAETMAQGGADWREILQYYFPGCEISE